MKLYVVLFWYAWECIRIEFATPNKEYAQQYIENQGDESMNHQLYELDWDNEKQLWFPVAVDDAPYDKFAV